MQKIKGLLLRACGYTTLILFLLLAFLSFNKTDSNLIVDVDLTRFMLVFLFGCIISATDLVLGINAIPKIWRKIIHFAVLFITFCIVFMSMGNLWVGNQASIFSAVIIFSFFYAIVAVAAFLIKKLVDVADSKLDSKAAKKPVAPKKEKKEYVPRYKD